MEGGVLIVNGGLAPNSLYFSPIGSGMCGGEIHINGDVSSYKVDLAATRKEITWGKLYFDGELIVDK